MQEVDCLLTYVILAGWSWEEEGGEDFGCGIVVVRGLDWSGQVYCQSGECGLLVGPEVC